MFCCYGIGGLEGWGAILVKLNKVTSVEEYFSLVFVSFCFYCLKTYSSSLVFVTNIFRISFFQIIIWVDL